MAFTEAPTWKMDKKSKKETIIFPINLTLQFYCNRWLGSTQLEQTEARRVMPCFDEPRFKASFFLKIERPNSFKPSLSNTLIQSSVPVQ
jgi:hypothetical protein